MPGRGMLFCVSLANQRTLIIGSSYITVLDSTSEIGWNLVPQTEYS